MLRAAIAHGEQLRPDGSMTVGFKNILDQAIALNKLKRVDVIIIPGGVTKDGFLSEAAVGTNYLKANGVNIPIWLEGRSTTFSENIRFMAESFPMDFEKVYVLARQTAMRRVEFLYGRFWPKAASKAEFIGTKSPQSRFERAMEYVLYVLARIDPLEKSFLMRYLKRRLRNKAGNE